MSELIIRLKRIISPIARKAHCDLRMPLPVWDDSGQAIGVSIECDKKMGPTECRGQATFALTPADYADDAKVIEKTELAVNALKNAVLGNDQTKEGQGGMTRATFVMRNGRLVRKDRAPVNAGPMVQSDYLGGQLEHHGYADGRRTDSKSTFRRWTKEAGLVEKGNDRERTERRQGDDRREMIRDVALATEMVKNGYRPQIRQFEE